METETPKEEPKEELDTKKGPNDFENKEKFKEYCRKVAEKIFKEQTGEGFDDIEFDDD